MQFYKSFPNYLVSDHKPIAGEFVFKVFSDYSDRLIKFGPIKKWCINEENVVYFTAEDTRVSDWDWIGVFKVIFFSLDNQISSLVFIIFLILFLIFFQYNFSALDEYVSFVYVNTVSSDSLRSNLSDENSLSNYSRRKEIRFPDGMVRTEGKYCLLYLTADSGSVLGMSSVFKAEFKAGKAFEC